MLFINFKLKFTLALSFTRNSLRKLPGQNHFFTHLQLGKCLLLLKHALQYQVLIFFKSGKCGKHIARCWKSLTLGKDMPQLPPEDDKTIKQVSFLEATTEALPQFTLSNIILRVYGVSDSLTTMILQYFSLGSSILSLFSTFIMVNTKQNILFVYWQT